MLRFLILVVYSISCAISFGSTNITQTIDARTENVNYCYLFHVNFPQPINKDTTLYVPCRFPASFVIELGALKEGQKSILVYNDNKELVISKYNGCYLLNGQKMDGQFDIDTKLSLHFINDKVEFYVDDTFVGYLNLKFDHLRKIGIRWSKKGLYHYNYLNCYKLCEFKEKDYGSLLEADIHGTCSKKVTSQNVGEEYSLTFPNSITCHSQQSIRFEYRFDDSKREDKTKTQRGRSEVSGVSSSSPLGKWVIDFDFYTPQENVDDQKYYDIITQLHDNSNVALSPAFCIGMKDGKMFCRLRGDSIPVEQWKQRNVPASGTHITTLGYLKKDTWHHVKIFLKLAYQRSMKPLTVIWLDSQKVFESDHPNCYNYKPKKEGKYDYLKFGIYKSSWLGLKRKPLDTDRRIYYFDNYKVKY